jgi:hypothetical protein
MVDREVADAAAWRVVVVLGVVEEKRKTQVRTPFFFLKEKHV